MTVWSFPQSLVEQDSGHVEALRKEHYNQCLLYTQGRRWSRVSSSSDREVLGLAETLYSPWEHIYSQQVSRLRHPSNAMEEELFSTDVGTLDKIRVRIRINEQAPDSKPHTK